MMVCVLVPLALTVLLTEASSGTEQAFPCPPRWLLFGQRCFAFYPVWSSWSTANSLCSRTGGKLVSLHTPEERRFVHQLAKTQTPLWLGGYQEGQNGSWFWSDDSPFRIRGWTNQRQGKTSKGGSCMEMDPKSGELHSAPCGELRFYICSTLASSSPTVSPSNKKPVEPGILPGVSLFDVVWGYSNLLAEEILHSSSFLKELRSGRMTQHCYTSFLQQEALYLHRVSSTLEALISGLQEADDRRSLLLDTFKHYSSRNKNLLASPAPQWLHFSLQSFHSVVLEEESVYWLVALSARACLRYILAKELLFSELRPGTLRVSGSKVKANSLYKEWSKDSLKEVTWTRRYRKVIKEYQDQMDVFKAINIFREHMMNQKSFFKAVDCEVEGDRWRRGGEQGEVFFQTKATPVSYNNKTETDVSTRNKERT